MEVTIKFKSVEEAVELLKYFATRKVEVSNLDDDTTKSKINQMIAELMSEQVLHNAKISGI
jgi:hypothetical protein